MLPTSWILNIFSKFRMQNEAMVAYYPFLAFTTILAPFATHQGAPGDTRRICKHNYINIRLEKVPLIKFTAMSQRQTATDFLLDSALYFFLNHCGSKKKHTISIILYAVPGTWFWPAAPTKAERPLPQSIFTEFSFHYVAECKNYASLRGQKTLRYSHRRVRGEGVQNKFVAVMFYKCSNIKDNCAIAYIKSLLHVCSDISKMQIIC